MFKKIRELDSTVTFVNDIQQKCREDISAISRAMNFFALNLKPGKRTADERAQWEIDLAEQETNLAKKGHILVELEADLAVREAKLARRYASYDTLAPGLQSLAPVLTKWAKLINKVQKE